MLESNFSSVMQQNYIHVSDINHLIPLLAKTDFDQTGDIWVKDGLVFASAQQDYNEGVNPFTLQWKDNFCSFFPLRKNKQGFFVANLTLTETFEFETVDELAIPQS